MSEAQTHAQNAASEGQAAVAKGTQAASKALTNGASPNSDTGSNPSTQESVDDSHKLPQSATVNHILDYPITQDALHFAFEWNPLGRGAKTATKWTYRKVGRPFVPLLYKPPATWLHPITKKMDDFSEGTLNLVDREIPELQKPTKEIWSDAKTAMWFPFTIPGRAWDSYCTHFDTEYKRFPEEDQDIITKSKAMASSFLLVGSDACSAMSDFIITRKERGEEAAERLQKDAKDAADKVPRETKEAAKESKEIAMDDLEKAKGKVKDAIEQSKDRSRDITEEARNKTEEAKEKAGGAAEGAKDKGEEIKGEAEQKTAETAGKTKGGAQDIAKGAQ